MRPGTRPAAAAPRAARRAARAARVVHVARAVGGRDAGTARLDADVVQERVERSLRDRREGERDVGHDVAHEVHLAAARPRARGSPPRSSVEQSSSVARVVGQHTVQLLGHRRGRTSACRPRRGRAARRLARRRGRPRGSCSCRRRRARGSGCSSPSTGSSAARIRAVCAVFVPAPASSSRVGRGHAELLEEDPRELVVVVLAGVDDHLVGDLAQLPGDRRRLDELRAVADDRDDQPAASSSSMSCRSAAPTSRVRLPSGSSRPSMAAID